MGKSTHRQGHLFVISGPSGAGKGTVCKKLLQDFDVRLSVSMTTRAPRPDEREGREYFFVTEEQFRRDIAEGKLLEYAEVYDHLYGTPKEAVLRQLGRGQDVILEIDIQGGLQVRERMPEETVLIFLLPPDLETLRARIRGRGTETEAVIERRFREATNEIRLIGEYDYYVVNDDLTQTVSDVSSIITAVRRRVPDKVMPIIRRYEEQR